MMNDPPQNSASRLEVYAVPALLTIIALNQIWLAVTTELTPWKGGGFGMFAAVDNAGARGLKCTAVDHEGRSVTVHLDGAIDRYHRDRLIAFPTEGALRVAALQVLSHSFVPFDAGGKSVAERMRISNPDQDIQVGLLSPDVPIYRVLGERATPEVQADAIRLSAVELTFFRLGWNSETARLHCVPVRSQMVRHETIAADV